MPERAAGNDPSLSEAVERVVESSQRALLARIELLRLEAEEDLSRTLRSAGVALSGVLVLAVAWMGAMALSVYCLGGQMSLGGRLALVVALNAVVGAALVTTGARAMSRLRLMRPDQEGDE